MKIFISTRYLMTLLILTSNLIASTVYADSSGVGLNISRQEVVIGNENVEVEAQIEICDNHHPGNGFIELDFPAGEAWLLNSIIWGNVDPTPASNEVAQIDLILGPRGSAAASSSFDVDFYDGGRAILVQGIEAAFIDSAEASSTGTQGYDTITITFSIAGFPDGISQSDAPLTFQVEGTIEQLQDIECAPVDYGQLESSVAVELTHVVQQLSNAAISDIEASFYLNQNQEAKGFFVTYTDSKSILYDLQYAAAIPDQDGNLEVIAHAVKEDNQGLLNIGQNIVRLRLKENKLDPGIVTVDFAIGEKTYQFEAQGEIRKIGQGDDIIIGVSGDD